MAKKVNLDVAQTLNITCRRGDTFALNMTLKDSEGVPIALDGSNNDNSGPHKFAMQVRRSAFQDGVEGLIASTTQGSPSEGGDGIALINEISGNASGAITILIESSAMETIPSGRYVYDLQVIDPLGAQGIDTITTRLKGSFVVNEDVTDTSNAPFIDPNNSVLRQVQGNRNGGFSGGGSSGGGGFTGGGSSSSGSSGSSGGSGGSTGGGY